MEQPADLPPDGRHYRYEDIEVRPPSGSTAGGSMQKINPRARKLDWNLITTASRRLGTQGEQFIVRMGRTRAPSVSDTLGERRSGSPEDRCRRRVKESMPRSRLSDVCPIRDISAYILRGRCSADFKEGAGKTSTEMLDTVRPSRKKPAGRSKQPLSVRPASLYGWSINENSPPTSDPGPSDRVANKEGTSHPAPTLDGGS
jgi:hypothetical protein